MSNNISLQWKIKGMDCSGCKLSIERVLTNTRGVIRADVGFVSENMIVEFDPNQTNQNTIEKKVTNLGYELHEHTDTPRQTSFDPEGPQENTTKQKSIAWHKSWFLYKGSKHLIFSVILLSLGLCFDFVSNTSPKYLWSTISLITGFPILKKAFFEARSGLFFSIETLVTLAIFGAIIIGASEEAAMVVFLFLCGEWLEGLAAGKARKNIGHIFDIAPQKAWKIVENNAIQVDVASLEIGDIVEVRVGDRVPTDGTIIFGEGQVDESLVTGESTPRLKKVEEKLRAGTLNLDSQLFFQVSATSNKNSLSQLNSLIDKAEKNKAPIERFIETFSRTYTPCVILVAALVALLPPLFSSHEVFSVWVYRALGVLLIGCPCALVISVPATISATLARAASLGILVKTGAAIEVLSQAKAICLDKTGTVTKGLPDIQGIASAESFDSEEILSVAASVSENSMHPLAKAINRFALKNGTPLQHLQKAKTLHGHGMSGFIENTEIRVLAPRSVFDIVSADTMETQLKSFLEAEESKGHTVSGVVIKNDAIWKLIGWLSFKDELKTDATAAIKRLKQLGFNPLLLTGDSPAAAHSIQKLLNIEGFSHLLPEHKFQKISELKSKFGKVIMVGDGINDAPALAAADVGIAFASGTDLAADHSDVVLRGENVLKVADAVELSRASKKIIFQNISFTLGLKLVFLVTTIFGYTGLWIAVLSDTGATLVVTLNAMSLLGWKSKLSPT